MKFIISSIISIGTLSLINASSVSFVDLQIQLNDVLTEETKGMVRRLTDPMLDIAGIDKERNLDGMNVDDIFSALNKINNAVEGFHSTIAISGGYDLFKTNSNDLLASMTDGLIGHCNIENTVPDKVHNLTRIMQQIQDLAFDMIYYDLYNLAHTDVSKLMEVASKLVEPTEAISQDLKDMMDVLKSWNSGPARRLFEHIEDLAGAVHRSLSVIDDVTSVACRVEPVLEKIAAFVEFVTSPDIVELLKQVESLLASSKFDNTLMDKIDEALLKLIHIFETIDPLVFQEIMPLVDDILHYFATYCANNAHQRLLMAFPMRQLSPDAISTIFQLLDDIVGFLNALISKIPEEYINSIFELAKSVAALLNKGPNSPIIEQVLTDAQDIFTQSSKILKEVQVALPVAETTIRDILHLFDDAKTLVMTIIQLFKIIISR